MMSLREQAAKGVAWSTVQNWGAYATSLAVFLVLARLLEPRDFGLVALAGVFIALVHVFLDQGVSQAIVQRPRLDPEHLDSAFWLNVGTGALLTGTVVALAGPVAALFDEPQLASVIRWLALSLAIGSFAGVQQALLRRRLLFRALAVRTLAAALVGGAVGVSLAVLGYGVWSLVAQQIVTAFVGTLVLWRASTWRPRARVSFGHLRELVSFGANIVGTNLLNFVNRRSDDFLIGLFLGPVALGLYTVAYRILRIVTDLVTSTVTQVAVPTFARLQDDRGRLVNAFYKATRLTSLVSFPVFLALAVVAPELIVGLFGEQWAPSIRVMQILVFIGILHSMYFFNAAVIIAVGKPSWLLGLTAINAAVNIVGFLIAVRWGIVAVAAAYVVRGYLLSPLGILAVRRLVGIDVPTYLRQYVGPVGASLAMVGAMVVLKEALGASVDSNIVLASAVAVGGLVYVAAIRTFAPGPFREVVEVARLAVSTSRPIAAPGTNELRGGATSA